MQKSYQTKRLILHELSPGDVAFIFELVNTESWKRFIGDRNIKTLADAENYIRKIIHNPGIQYRVVSVKDTLAPVGIITLIKRDYLPHHDIGFAFLPHHTGQGYAFEAASAVLHDLFHSRTHTTILASTLKENTASVHLLKKLGFTYLHEITLENNNLDLYTVSAAGAGIPV